MKHPVKITAALAIVGTILIGIWFIDAFWDCAYRGKISTTTAKNKESIDVISTKKTTP